MNNVAMIISKRLTGLGVLTMFMVSVIIFLAVNMLPGDFAQALLGQSATPEAVAAIRKDLGLDKPFYTRYFDWLVGVLQFDFGTSFAKANFHLMAAHLQRRILVLWPTRLRRALPIHCSSPA